MGRFEAMSGEVAEVLCGVNRYNPTNAELLQEYVDVQLAEEAYDADANLTLLKLYQLNPDSYSADAVVSVLLKALMALPLSDMTLCKSLIDAAHFDDPELVAVFKLGEALEKCQFRVVWESLASAPLHAKLASVRGFSAAVRKFVCHTVNITYQSVPKHVLLALLGSPEEKDLATICKDEGWKMGSDDFVFIANQEVNVKNKNIQEKVELADLAEILKASAANRG